MYHAMRVSDLSSVSVMTGLEKCADGVVFFVSLLIPSIAYPRLFNYIFAEFYFLSNFLFYI
jgi:hypothetical protein